MSARTQDEADSTTGQLQSGGNFWGMCAAVSPYLMVLNDFRSFNHRESKQETSHDSEGKNCFKSPEFLS